MHPRVLEQVVSCRDDIAQQYLMQCIIQGFPDDFHLGTLSGLLAALPQLQPGVRVHVILSSLLDRLARFGPWLFPFLAAVRDCHQNAFTQCWLGWSLHLTRSPVHWGNLTGMDNPLVSCVWQGQSHHQGVDSQTKRHSKTHLHTSLSVSGCAGVLRPNLPPGSLCSAALVQASMRLPACESTLMQLVCILLHDGGLRGGLFPFLYV